MGGIKTGGGLWNPPWWLVIYPLGALRATSGLGGDEEDAAGLGEEKDDGRGFWKLDAREEAVLAGNEYTSGPVKGLAYRFQQRLHGFSGLASL